MSNTFKKLGIGVKKGFQKVIGVNSSLDPSFDNLNRQYENEKKQVHLTDKKMKDLIKSLMGLSNQFGKVTQKFIGVFQEFSDEASLLDDKYEELKNSVEGFSNTLRDLSAGFENDCCLNLRQYGKSLDDTMEVIFKREKSKMKFDKQTNTVERIGKKFEKKKNPKDEVRFEIEKNKLKKMNEEYNEVNKETKDFVVDMLNRKPEILTPFSENFFNLCDKASTDLVTNVEHLSASFKSIAENLKGKFKGPKEVLHDDSGEIQPQLVQQTEEPQKEETEVETEGKTEGGEKGEYFDEVEY